VEVNGTACRRWPTCCGTWPARRVDTEQGTLTQGLAVRLHLRRREARPRSTSATRAASGPATRRWRAGAAWPRAGIACGVPVVFVQDRWYRDHVMVPRRGYDERRWDRRDERRDDRRDRRDDRDRYKGGGRDD
jgi:hypothetical protein